VIVDRCLQARVVNALEPEWEARFEPRSYGFRPGRGCHDAIDAIFHIARGANPRRCWALDADLAAAFDRIDHSHLLSQLCTFPDRGLIADWLKAGMIDRGRFSPTEEGTPQGGLCVAEQNRVFIFSRAVLTLINSAPYGDLAIGQIWTRELDEGRYLCSMSSMYRIARAAGQTRERRRQATHPAKVKPELMADAPSQIWSWDITKLRGPSKGIFYHLYVLIDIFSRYNPGWLVSTCEESNLAADFIAGAIGRNGAAPHSVHADRGTSMTSKPVSMLLTDLGVTRSHSRPHVSNDNPFERHEVA